MVKSFGLFLIRKTAVIIISKCPTGNTRVKLLCVLQQSRISTVSTAGIQCRRKPESGSRKERGMNEII